MCCLVGCCEEGALPSCGRVTLVCSTRAATLPPLRSYALSFCRGCGLCAMVVEELSAGIYGQRCAHHMRHSRLGPGCRGLRVAGIERGERQASCYRQETITTCSSQYYSIVVAISNDEQFGSPAQREPRPSCNYNYNLPQVACRPRCLHECSLVLPSYGVEVPPKVRTPYRICVTALLKVSGLGLRVGGPEGDERQPSYRRYWTVEHRQVL
ncbi:hypothetical protein BC629DRAFT_966145 [Irpex lacteus]|nr:hypothetical protein BC629DRAFT_966145 [Irpex lacteus]